MKKKKSFFLCVFGPDGCGKSSVFNELDRIYGPNKIAHFHWRPGLFPYKSKVYYLPNLLTREVLSGCNKGIRESPSRK